jgi:hypothetical protein
MSPGRFLPTRPFISLRIVLIFLFLVFVLRLTLRSL